MIDGGLIKTTKGELMVKITDKTDYSRFVRPDDEDEGIWLDYLEVHLVTHPAGQVKEVHVHDPPQDHVITIRSGRMRWTVEGEAYGCRPRRRDRHAGRRRAQLLGARGRGREGRVCRRADASQAASPDGKDRRARRLACACLPQPDRAEAVRSRERRPQVPRSSSSTCGSSTFRCTTRTSRIRPKRAEHLLESCYSADGLIWSSPLYQGTISGAFKNALDWLHLIGNRDPPYLHDKVIGLLSAAGGAHGLQAINTMEFSVRALRGWAVPYVVPISGGVFDSEGELRDEGVEVQLDRLGREVVRVAARFAEDSSLDREDECTRTAELVAAA